MGRSWVGLLNQTMIVLADSADYAEELLLTRLAWEPADANSLGEELAPLVHRLFTTKALATCASDSESLWRYLFVVKQASESQFDVVNDLCSQGLCLPAPILCVAGQGEGFHGFKQREWVSLAGNIHLTALFTPNRQLAHAGVGFTVLSVVSVLEAIDRLPAVTASARVKWVNDIVVAGAKVGGVLAGLHSMGDTVSAAIVGIGLNVEATPAVPRDPFIPAVGALCSFATDASCKQGVVFANLISSLHRNYQHYLSGRYGQLLDFYRERSLIVGHEVHVLSDVCGHEPREMAHGRVVEIGEDLELYIDNHQEPITRGRVILPLDLPTDAVRQEL